MEILFDGDIVIFDNFLSPEECSKINTWLNNFNYSDLKPNDIEFWHKRLIRQDQTTAQPGYEKSFDEVDQLIKSIKSRIIESVNSVNKDEWKLSEVNFLKMFNGSNPFPERRNKDLEMFYHTDNQESNGYLDEIFWGCVIYPNETYVGGEIYYPKHRFKYKPKAGSMVIHGGNVRHGVLLVSAGTRYSIASTITK